MPAYFCRSLIRCKQIEYRKATEKAEETGKSESKLISDSPQVLDYELICADLDKVIELAPDFGYAYYNRGNILSQQSDYHAAIVDYNKAIEYNPNFAEAYYNRGLTYIFLGHNKEGIADLSKAGELGLFKAYNIIKRYTEKEE